MRVQNPNLGFVSTGSTGLQFAWAAAVIGLLVYFTKGKARTVSYKKR